MARIDKQLLKIAEQAEVEQVDPFELRTEARRVAAQAEMLERGYAA